MSRFAPAQTLALAVVALACVACAASAPPSTSVSTLDAATVAAPTIAAAPSSDYCREYRSTAEIAGAPREVVGTACRQPDGSWKFVDTPSAAAQTGAPTVTNSTTTYVVPYPSYYGPWGPYYGPGFAFSSAFVFGGHHHHRCWRC